MTSFSEEKLDSSAGYFSGEPGATLHNGEWTIVRKLGWGSRSSTWLAVSSKDPNNFEAIKIFTVDATQDRGSANELDLLQGPLKDDFQTLPSLRSSFYVESAKGKHLALILHVLGGSLESFRLQHGGSLPVAAVKKIVADVLESLAVLQKKKIVHGAVNAENILFSGSQQGSDITAAVAASPNAQAEQVTDAQGNVYNVVKSQPFSPESVDDISGEALYLSNFGHARPEQGDVSSKSDILALGRTAYLLLTGSQYSGTPEAIEQSLTSSGKLAGDEISATAVFLGSLLATNPAQRLSAVDLLGNNWLQ
ncbi:hypothetical protein GALMADRAFT_271177 [Galerina marginata CBS 339.88]|uniref:non-specific serine/threonine protein kinase n=1 Tax=Galerina marginata (strain CBS 339.88) TaxID=685588 RepID=A0A067SJV7_GALM3|nr:hypothetical protein GALMADRAFT_271177 [Galerina marginata CBS 339.88]